MKNKKLSRAAIIHTYQDWDEDWFDTLALCVTDLKNGAEVEYVNFTGKEINTTPGSVKISRLKQHLQGYGTCDQPKVGILCDQKGEKPIFEIY